MKAIFSDTDGEFRIYKEMKERPNIGDGWICDHEGAKVVAWASVNGEVSGNGIPKDDYNFFRLVIGFDDDQPEFKEYIAVRKRTPKERYDARTARFFSLKLNKNTDAALIEKLESVDSVQGYIKDLIRKDIE